MGDVQHHGPEPVVPVPVALIHMLLRLAVRRKIPQHKIFIVPVQQIVIQSPEIFPFVIHQPVHQPFDHRIRTVQLPGRIAAVLVIIHDLVRRQSENLALRRAYRLTDFHVGSVQGAQG